MRRWRAANPEKNKEAWTRNNRRMAAKPKVPPPAEKACNKCGVIKPASEYQSDRTTSTGIRARCRSCSVEDAYAWNRANPERFRRNQRRYTLKKKYGISLEEFDAMLAAQGGGCAICAATEGGKYGWHVDHCHRTGKVRGLLCGRCNRCIGFMSDDPELLRRAVQYLSGALF